MALARSALTLQHTARVIENASPLRVDIKLDRIMLDRGCESWGR